MGPTSFLGSFFAGANGGPKIVHMDHNLRCSEGVKNADFPCASVILQPSRFHTGQISFRGVEIPNRLWIVGGSHDMLSHVSHTVETSAGHLQFPGV